MEHGFMNILKKAPRVGFGLLFFLLLANRGAYSQVNSQVSAYTETNFTATWTSIDGTGTQVPTFNVGPIFTSFSSVPLPFDFPYDGTAIPSGTVLEATKGGCIVLGDFTVPRANPDLGGNGIVAVGDPTYPAILAFFQGGGQKNANPATTIWYQVDGTEPNRVLTIEYNQWKRINQTVLMNVQVKLYETTGVIEFIYQNHSFDFGSQPIGGTIDPSFDYNCIGINGLGKIAFSFFYIF